MKSIAQKMAEKVTHELNKTESPIEKKIVTELVYFPVEFQTQFVIKPYRLDVAFPNYKVGLELDGSMFHDQKQKDGYDKNRDEYLRNLGWKIERVPGWFAYRNPLATVVKALRHIPEIHNHERYKQGVNQALSWFVLERNRAGEFSTVNSIFDLYE